MGDILDSLAMSTINTIESGYYSVKGQTDRVPVSLKKAIHHAEGNPIIAEIKGASPSAGVLRDIRDPASIAVEMETAGASGISILTEPTRFKGSLENVSAVRKAVSLPILMKDFFISKIQIDAARMLGADAVLLIATLYTRGYGKSSLPEMISYAHEVGLEVLLETHSIEEFKLSIETDADLIGINNRDLSTQKIDTDVTLEILRAYPNHKRTVISESGIKNPADIRCLKEHGVNGFLIGTAIMQSKDLFNSVKEFVEA